MMQTPLFLCETKRGFSKCSVFWKVGSGFESPTSPRAPLYENAIEKDIMLGEGVQNTRARGRFEGQLLIFQRGITLPVCVEGFGWFGLDEP